VSTVKNGCIQPSRSTRFGGNSVLCGWFKRVAGRLGDGSQKSSGNGSRKSSGNGSLSAGEWKFGALSRAHWPVVIEKPTCPFLSPKQFSAAPTFKSYWTCTVRRRCRRRRRRCIPSIPPPQFSINRYHPFTLQSLAAVVSWSGHSLPWSRSLLHPPVHLRLYCLLQVELIYISGTNKFSAPGNLSDIWSSMCISCSILPLEINWHMLQHVPTSTNAVMLHSLL
jgi:hypothetical protein